MVTSKTGAAAVSLVAGILILATKLMAWKMTGSAALLADGLESLVNVGAALVALFSLRVAQEPQDKNHPYGHGKVEQMSAAFEGGLVFAAGSWISFESALQVLSPAPLKSVDLGLALSVGAAAANALLGWWLLRRGRKLNSIALEADGKHVLSDVYTTAGALLGLLLAWLTGWTVLDPLTAVGVGLLLLWTGARIFKRALDALMDAEDPELIKRLTDAFLSVNHPGFHGLHRVRAIQSGHFIHVDAHVYVPAHWTVEEAHHKLEALELAMKKVAPFEGELALHLDPSHHVQ